MKQLSEIQNGLFHINPKTMEFTAATFKTDHFIDKDQLDDFIWSAVTGPFVPADDNYMFSLIDFNALGSDLVIIYKYDSIACCPYPAKAYLSRHHISIADFTDQKIPPPVVMNVVKGYEPYHHDKITALVFCINNYELTVDERIYRHRSDGCEGIGKSICDPGVCEEEHVECNSCLPESYCKTFKQPVSTNFSTNAAFLGSSDKTVGAGVGYLSNVYVNVISGRIAVWIGKTYPRCIQEQPDYSRPCLPRSAWPTPKEPIYLVRVSSGNPCIGEPVFPEPAKKTCVWTPPPPERTTPAATNWSYNYHKSPDLKRLDGSPVDQDSRLGNACPSCR